MKTLLFLILISLTTNYGWGDVTVCASGCNTTTIANAMATATATPNSIIDLNDNSQTNNAVTVGVINTSLTINLKSKANTITNTNASTDTITINGATGPVSILNGTVNNNASSGTARTITVSTFGTGGSLYVGNCNILKTTNSTQGLVADFFNLVTTNQIVLDRDYLMPSAIGSSAVSPGAVTGVSNSWMVTNCALIGPAGSIATGLNFGGVLSPNVEIKAYNCLISGWNLGSGSGGGGDIKNCLFFNNTTDASVSGAGTLSNFTYDGFSQLPSGAGVSCIYGLTTAREFCDRNNYWIGPSSQTRGKGVSITGITQTLLGLNGVMQGWTGQQDMGPNPYTPDLCPGLGAGK